MEALLKACKVLADIADAYDANNLDDEARKFYGRSNEIANDRKKPSDIILYSGRGGKELLTLQDCLDARDAIDKE